MLGMIKKDLFMIKNSLKSIIFALIIFVFYTIMFDMDMYFLLPFMTLMISITTFSYDDFNNWHSFASTLPQGKVNVVKSKYITTISLIVITTIISVAFNYIMRNIKGTLNIEESLSSIMGELLAVIFMMSVLFPILFKYGAEKGRIAMFTIGFGIVGLFVLLKKIVKIEIPKGLIAFLDSHFLIIFIIAIIVLIGISYVVSKKIYSKREF
ncbi:MAG: ABC-2 transporter permease [Bacilli bacterium]|nr:ABC-2 transporter permease [Bacilli bacterium]